MHKDDEDLALDRQMLNHEIAMGEAVRYPNLADFEDQDGQLPSERGQMAEGENHKVGGKGPMPELPPVMKGSGRPGPDGKPVDFIYPYGLDKNGKPRTRAEMLRDWTVART